MASIDISQVYNYYISAGASPQEAADYTAYYISDVRRTKKIPGTPKYKTQSQLAAEYAPNYSSFYGELAGSNDAFAVEVANKLANGASYTDIEKYVYDNKDLLKDYYTVSPKGSSREQSFMNKVGRAKSERDKYVREYNKQQAALSYSGLSGAGAQKYDFNIAGKYADANTIEYQPYRAKYDSGKKAIEKILTQKGITGDAQKQYIDMYNKSFETAAKTNISNIKTSPLLDKALGKTK